MKFKKIIKYILDHLVKFILAVLAGIIITISIDICYKDGGCFGSKSIEISYIYYDVKVDPNQNDEYVVITNMGNNSIDLLGWRLNAGSSGQDFIFPNYIIDPGESCRVYSKNAHPEYCGFCFQSKSSKWNNNGDCGYLYNPKDKLMNEYCYD